MLAWVVTLAVLRSGGGRPLLPPQSRASRAPLDAGAIINAQSRINKIRTAFGGQTSLEGALDAMAQESEDRVLERARASSATWWSPSWRSCETSSSLRRERDRRASPAPWRSSTSLESEADDRKQEIADALATGGIFFIGTRRPRPPGAARWTTWPTTPPVPPIASPCVRLDGPAEFAGLMVQMVEVDLEAVHRLRAAIGAMQHDFREALTIAAEIDKIESRADDIFADVYRLMFDMDTDFKTFHQLKSIIERLESIADKCAHNARAHPPHGAGVPRVL